MALQLVTAAEMVSDLADRTGWSKSDVRTFLDHFGNFTLDNVAEGYRVKLPGGIVVGAQVTPARKARKGRNPATGEEIQIPKAPASAKVKAKIVQPLSAIELPSVATLKRRS
jgi:DNA-binding protein HU-beta